MLDLHILRLVLPSAFASYGAGKLKEYDYRKTALAHGFTINRVSGDKLAEFPIEKARPRSVYYYIFMSSTSILGYSICNPDAPATASASVSVTRCLAAAVGVVH